MIPLAAHPDSDLYASITDAAPACAAVFLPFLTHLNLSHNPAGDGTARTVAALLANPDVYVRDIDLSETGITAKGARVLLDSLLANGHMQGAALADTCWEILGQCT